MLEAIVAVTLTVADLDTAESAYRDHFSYQVVERGEISAPQAALWAAPRSQGNSYVILQPESGEPVYLRLVQQAPVEGYATMKTWGWNSNEILVQDTYAVHEHLKGSPFRVIGEPRGLSMNPEVIAMQVLGTEDELIYLTRIPQGKSLFNLGSAKSFIDRTFIVVLGGPDIEAMRAFYRDTFGMPTTDPAPSTISVLANAWGLPQEQQFPLGIVRFPQNFLIELDEYPPAATARPQRDGELPPGIAMVSFTTGNLDSLSVSFLADPAAHDGAIYGGRRAAITRGAAGEWIELIESD